MGASGRDLLCAIVTGFEAQNGWRGTPRWQGGIYASQTVAFGAVVSAARLLKLTDEQTAHAIGITAMTMGGLAIGTDSQARDTGARTPRSAPSTLRWPPARGLPSTDMLEAKGRFVEVFGAGRTAESDRAGTQDRAIVKSVATSSTRRLVLSRRWKRPSDAARQSAVPPRTWPDPYFPVRVSRPWSAAVTPKIFSRRSTACRLCGLRRG